MQSPLAQEVLPEAVTEEHPRLVLLSVHLEDPAGTIQLEVPVGQEAAAVVDMVAPSFLETELAVTVLMEAAVGQAAL